METPEFYCAERNIGAACKVPCKWCEHHAPSEIATQMESDDDEDALWEDEDDFQCCDDCDLPDACSDYGCAIKQGLREPTNF